ncbi:hypothetical protein [Dyadobacter sandarakinus]|uniref:Sensory transduction regulator n=1 Tax=Dyadobacter sandarakinus TaxID=2747268 RepID=A0ABX7ICR2_9BACT|nr:hypothetical protein [Dyadobacter sandarakinus]QRR03322.1 hypothetical protein HWI92_21580 [Dyadobacter sandarakinus]
MTAEELRQAFVSGNILCISDPQIANGIPHYHIFIKKIEGKYLTTVCCTSQFEKNVAHIRRVRESLDTLVCIDHETPDNWLHDFTYVNCNGYLSYTEDELLLLNARRDIPFCGVVTAFEFQKIIHGFLISRRIDEDFKEEVRGMIR